MLELRIFHPSRAMAIAWEYCLSKSDDLEASHLADQMEMDLLDRIPGTKVIGAGYRRLEYLLY